MEDVTKLCSQISLEVEEEEGLVVEEEEGQEIRDGKE